MAETKFTPGPWYADIRSGCLAVYPASRTSESMGVQYDHDRNIHYSNRDAHIVGDHWDMSEQARHDAHLIAAAPEMYHMLEVCRDIFGVAFMQEQYDAIEALLAKARGEA